MDERETKHVDNLVRRSGAVLKSFRSGHAPTFEQLDRLETALAAFTIDKVCGHSQLEECDCLELNRMIVVEAEGRQA